MSPEQIKALIQQEIQQSNASSRYQLTPIQSHTHDGINSPTAFQPILVYAGRILSNGTIIPPSPGADSGLLPTGWTCVKNTTGDYTITHNLGTKLYSIVATPIGTSTAPSVAFNDNVAEIIWFDTATQALTDTPFNFTLVVVNNRKTTIPTYEPSAYLTK